MNPKYIERAWAVLPTSRAETSRARGSARLGRVEPRFWVNKPSPAWWARTNVMKYQCSWVLRNHAIIWWKLDCETRRWIRDPYNWRIILIVTEIVRYVVDKSLQNVFIWSNLRIATHDDELIHDSENDKVVYIYYWQLELWTKKELSLINKWKKTELSVKIALIIAMMIVNLLCRLFVSIIEI